MKKTLLILAFICGATSANAQWHHHGHYNHYRGGYYGNNWVAPALIGGIIGYELSKPAPVVVQQPVIVQQPPVVYQTSQSQNCTAWVETQQQDGTITRTRNCTQ